MRMPRIGDRISFAQKSVIFALMPQCFQWARHSHSSNYDKWGVVTHQKLPKWSSELGGCWNFDWKVIIARGFIIELKYLRNVNGVLQIDSYRSESYILAYALSSHDSQATNGRQSKTALNSMKLSYVDTTLRKMSCVQFRLWVDVWWISKTLVDFVGF